MSIEIVSFGKFDYSVFNLSSTEENIISSMINYDISSYHITKDIDKNSIEFFFNNSNLNQDNANKLFSSMFNLMEQDFTQHKLTDFNISILQYSFKFSRTQGQGEYSQQVSWHIDCEHIEKIKLDLFNFFHKNFFYQELLYKLKKKNIYEKLHKI